MAVPKKRTGASAQGHRRANWKAALPSTTICPNCGELALTHTVCTACGQYKGKVVSRKAEGFVESVEIIKEKPKKAVKKAPAKRKAAEVKVEETITEEVTVSEKATEETTEPVVEAKEIKEENSEE
jgi:large subunit ribosomal protein L32